MPEKGEVETYIGTKIIDAWPEARDGKEGYGVQYPDGYVSWSPRDAFEAAYRTSGSLDFGAATALLKRGYLLRRKGWNGAGMFIYLVPGSNFSVNRAPLDGIFPTGTPISYRAHIDMKTAQGDCVPWVASQSDLLAEDWEVV